MALYCDNKATISIAHDSVQYDRTKHIEVDQHFIKENIQWGWICTLFVRTRDQLANILTKGVNGVQFHDVVSKPGMIDIYSLA